jgi:flagellar protein FliS
MSYGRKALGQYNKVASEAEAGYASQHRLVQMLMEGVLARVATAKGQIERKDFGGKSGSISSAMAIINALKSSLDMDAGGEIAANLDDLYGYMYNRLIDANTSNQTQPLTEVSSLMSQIKSGWDAMPDEIKSHPPKPV